jgi:HK97 family phage portal protein
VRIFGLDITRTKSAPRAVHDGAGWWPLVREPYAGAWQRGDEWSVQTVLAHHAVYTCITLIASDIGKLRPKLVERDDDGIWSELMRPSPFHPVLRKPNHFQTHIQFKEWWITSKLIRGNTYALKERDDRGLVRALYLLDPLRVKPLVAPDGSVFYELSADELASVRENKIVPASEIIHDRMNCLFHPLVGVGPIFASGMAANVGLKIEANSANFFGNGSNPSGILTAPGTIPQATADRLADQWRTSYSGANAGKVAVLGDGLTFDSMRMSAVEAQMIEHLKWTAETVASTFHIPAFKIGVGAMPTYQNAEILNQIYYSDCLQSHIEQFELCMDEGLGLHESKDGHTYGVELDLDTLLRMDTATQIKALGEGVGAGVIAPNEARRKIDLPPVTGGDTPYLQQQNYSLAALDKRDQNDPFAAPVADSPPVQPAPADIDERSAPLFWKAASLDYERAA